MQLPMLIINGMQKCLTPFRQVQARNLSLVLYIQRTPYKSTVMHWPPKKEEKNTSDINW